MDFHSRVRRSGASIVCLYVTAMTLSNRAIHKQRMFFRFKQICHGVPVSLYQQIAIIRSTNHIRKARIIPFGQHDLIDLAAVAVSRILLRIQKLIFQPGSPVSQRIKFVALRRPLRHRSPGPVCDLRFRYIICDVSRYGTARTARPRSRHTARQAKHADQGREQYGYRFHLHFSPSMMSGQGFHRSSHSPVAFINCQRR